MVNEIELAKTFIFHRLAADAGLTALVGTRIYRKFQEKSAIYPQVMITYLAGTDTNTVGAGGRIFTRPLFLVEAVVADTNWLAAQAIADRIEAALDAASGVSGPVFVGPLFRERPSQREAPTPEGTILGYLGGQWRAMVSGG